MSKDSKTKEKFIELRAGGLSYDKIATKLNVSKPTLIKWCKKLRYEIQNMKAIELEVLQEKYYLTKRAQIEFYGKRVREIVKELDTRDLKEVSTRDLFKVLLECRERLEKENEPLVLREEGIYFDSKIEWPG